MSFPKGACETGEMKISVTSADMSWGEQGSFVLQVIEDAGSLTELAEMVGSALGTCAAFGVVTVVVTVVVTPFSSVVVTVVVVVGW